MKAAEISGIAEEIAAALLAKIPDRQQAVMACGIMAARITADAEPQNPDHQPREMARVLTSGFNSAMTLEMAGRPQNQSAPLGMNLV